MEELLRHGESHTVEFKIAPPRPSEMAERLCGLANSREGGRVIVGVKDNTWEVVGVKAPHSAIDNILQAARLCKPAVPLVPPQPQLVEFRGKKLVVAHIPPNNGTLYQAGGIYWLRSGTHTRPMDTEELSRFLYSQGTLKWELQPVEYATLEDLDRGKIEAYLTHLANLTGRAPRLGNQAELLLRLKCAVQTGDRDNPVIRPTNAGLLLFGYNPREFLNQAEIIGTYYQDNSGARRYTDRKTITGTIPEQIDQAADLLKLWIPVGAYMKGFHRIDEPALPLEALREAVVNAVVHRDYSLEGTAVRIFYYQDRVEIHNPGLLPHGITLERLRQGLAPSQPRNPVIASILKDMPGGYMERLGTGISYMIGQMREWNLPDPEFKEQDEFIALFSRRKEEVRQITEPGPAQEGSAFATFTAEERLEMAMRYVREHGFITHKQYRALTGASESTTIRDLDTLVEQGALRKTGKGPSRRYVL